MAKNKLTSFAKLTDALSKIAPDGAMLDVSPFGKIDEWIPTGWYILNAVLSGSLFGGMPNRRSLVFAGEEGTGKTFMALSIARNAQMMKYNVIYFDSEGAIDQEFVNRLGVDITKFMLQPVNTIEEFNHIASQIVKTYEDLDKAGEPLPKVMVVLDSLGNLSSSKEVLDSTEGSDKRDMTKQQQIRKLFRVNGMKFAKYGIPFIVNNHVYAKIGSYVPGNEVSGGGGIKYNASIILELLKKNLADEQLKKESMLKAKEWNVEPVKLGITVTVKPFKQRFARPIKADIHIPLYKKPNPFVGLEKFVSWDACGIMRGKALTEKEYNKLSDVEKSKCKEFTDLEGNTLYAHPKETARTLVCKHLGGEVSLLELFTEKVFTEAVLRELDENVIKPTFQLPSVESLEDLIQLEEEIEFGKDELTFDEE